MESFWKLESFWKIKKVTVDDSGPNDIDYLRMLPGQTNDDFTTGGPVHLQQRIRKLP